MFFYKYNCYSFQKPRPRSPIPALTGREAGWGSIKNLELGRGRAGSQKYFEIGAGAGRGYQKICESGRGRIGVPKKFRNRGGGGAGSLQFSKCRSLSKIHDKKLSGKSGLPNFFVMKS